MNQNNLKNFFSRFDFLDLKPNLLFYSKTRHVTWIGIIISLINICLIGAFAIFFITKLFQREYLVAISSTLTSGNPILNLTGIPVMFTLVDGTYHPFQDAEKIYSFQFQPLSGRTNAKGENFIFDFEPCNITKHFSEYGHFFNNINVSKYQCPSGLDQWDTTLAGAYGVEDYYKFQSLIINRCENTTNRSNCYPTDVIEKKILSVYVQMGFLDYDANNLDYKDPVKPLIKFETFPLSGTIFKRYYQYRKQAQYDTDDGFFFSEMRTKNYYQHDRTEVSVDLRVSLKFGTVNIVLSSNTLYTKRTYLKLQDVIASIGGMLNLIIFISTVIVHFLTRRQLYLALGNENFNFVKKKREKEEKKNLKENQPFTDVNTTEKNERNVSEIALFIPDEKTEPIMLPSQNPPKLPYQSDGEEYEIDRIKKNEEIYEKNQIQNSEQPSNFTHQVPFKKEKMSETKSKFTEDQKINSFSIGPKIINEQTNGSTVNNNEKDVSNISKKVKNTRKRPSTTDDGKIHINWKALFCPYPDRYVVKSIEAVKTGMSMDTILSSCADVQKLKQVLFEYPEIHESFKTLSQSGIHVDDYIKMSKMKSLK